MSKVEILIHKVLHQEAYKKRLYIFPFLFTFANALLGFLAITQAIEGNHSAAVYCVMLAAVMDMFDGRLARALGSASSLGLELDSLADGISFVLAPCVLVYAWYPGIIGYTGFLALGLYLSAGLFRLARFNLTAGKQGDYFTGLAVPIAAFFVVSLILYHEWILAHRVWFILYKRVPFILISLISFLMVSTIRFPSFKKYRACWRWYDVCGIFCLWLSLLYFFLQGYPLLLIGVSGYIVLSVGYHYLVRGTGE